MTNNYWKYGQRTKLAKLAGVSDQNLSDILHRKRAVGQHKAHLLEDASRRVLSEPIPWTEFMLNATSVHPAFFGEPESL